MAFHERLTTSICVAGNRLAASRRDKPQKGYSQPRIEEGLIKVGRHFARGLLMASK